MTATINLEEMQAKFKELIHQMVPGSELIITENEKPVATLVMRKPRKPTKRRIPGACKGMLTILVEDDEHLKEFEEYM